MFDFAAWICRNSLAASSCSDLISFACARVHLVLPSANSARVRASMVVVISAKRSSSAWSAAARSACCFKVVGPMAYRLIFVSGTPGTWRQSRSNSLRVSTTGGRARSASYAAHASPRPSASAFSFVIMPPGMSSAHCIPGCNFSSSIEITLRIFAVKLGCLFW